ncbi:zinc finger protein 337-like [Anopheles marshallii]|uniref:zinc finger protein 337-like n=1 Tax=Anopheles marshallii TaxID=1521116 RepID=UPI00237BB0E8|nr:zinc finger protein 337-like [Anopheles marshallii]
MKCVVPGCDTDDNVVSYTSVFYVNLPDDPVVQQQWFTLLEVTNGDLMQALSYGEVKVCSCHFAEDSFGRHPVHGYRYLSPTAMPTVLPSRSDSEELTPTKEPNSDKDSALDYFLVYLDEPPSIDQVALDQTPDTAELSLIDDLNDVEPPELTSTAKELKVDEGAEEALEENDDIGPVEEIGIEYANGKYYFLKLDDDPATSDNEARISEVDTNEHDDNGPAVIWEKEEDAETPTKIGQIEEEKPCSEISNESDGGDEVFQDNRMSSSDSESVNAPTNAVRLKKSSSKLMAEEDEFKVSHPDNTEVFEIVPMDLDKHNAYDESDTDQADADVERKYDTLSEVEYGSIEALDDESVCSDSNWKQNQDSQTDRFFCDVCGRGFRFKSTKDRHTLSHTKEKKFSCEVCGKGFTQKVNLTIHMRIHTGENPVKKFTCQICQKKCTRLSELEMHRASHFRRFPHVCPICTVRYSDATGFYDHFLTDHRGEMTLNELFELLSQNENNIVISGQEPDNIKSEDGTFGCTVCGKSYRVEANLERHKRRMHMKIYSCPHCARKFPYKSLLEKHLPTHTLEKPFKCPHCTLSYTQRVNLRIHIERKHTELNYTNENLFDGDESGDDQAKRDRAIAHPQTFDCEVCGKSFPRKPSLQLHRAAHANYSNPVTYDCDLCGISLCARISLLRHQTRVHGERRRKPNVLGNLELRNVTIVPTDDNQYVEIEDETDTIVEDYESEC